MDERKTVIAGGVLVALGFVLIGLVMCAKRNAPVPSTPPSSSSSKAPTSSASSTLLSGWAAIVKRTASSARIAVQLANVSQTVHTINAARIILKDTEGFTYPNKEVFILELLATYISLIPGEVWRYELEFDIPSSRQPEVLIVPLDLFESSTARVPVLQAPGRIVTQRVQSLQPSHSAEVAGLVWSLESIRLDESRGSLSLVLVIRNRGPKEIRLDTGAPYVADSTGRIAGILGDSGFAGWPAFPPEVKAGEVFKIPLSFSVYGFQKPLYLFIRYGLLSSESKIVWRVVNGT